MVAFGEGSELKGDLLFKGLRGKIQGVKPQEASEALIHVLSVAVKNSVQIFHGAIDRAGRAEWNRKHLRKSLQIQTDPEAAFDECLRRLDAFVHTFMPKERVLWIADRTGFEKSRKRGLKGFQFIQGTVSLRVLLENYANKGLADLGLRLNDARLHMSSIQFISEVRMNPWRFSLLMCVAPP